MFYDLIMQGDVPGDRPAVVETDRRVVRWRELREGCHELGRWLELPPRTRVGLVFRVASARALAWLAVLAKKEADVVLLPSRQPADWGMQTLILPGTASEVEWLATTSSLQSSANSGVTILTSGTSGRPKAVRHSWESILGPSRPNCPVGHQPCWLLAYQPYLYAGLQVIVQCLRDGGTLVLLPEDATPDQTVQRMADHHVQYASATPSFWRRLILFSSRDAWPGLQLRQITLGGEAVDQTLLDQLQAAFPAARMTHIYATTELGRCFAVNDGRAGFPARWLEQPPPGVQLRVIEDELHVCSEHAMSGYLEGPAAAAEPVAESKRWMPTGDLVRLEGDRVYFVGRRSDIVNVGGQKVHPLQVEQLIRQVPGVADVYVHGQASSITGQLVACQVVPQPDVPAHQLRRDILETCRRQLPRYQVPRVLDFVSHIDVARSGKRLRGSRSDEAQAAQDS